MWNLPPLTPPVDCKGESAHTLKPDILSLKKKLPSLRRRRCWHRKGKWGGRGVEGKQEPQTGLRPSYHGQRHEGPQSPMPSPD